MKISLQLICLSFLLILFVNCEGDEGAVGPVGPAGIQGPPGPQGPIGISGNANVRQYLYGAQNLASESYVTLQVSTTLDTMNRSAWNVYLYYQGLDRWYSIPGGGPGAATTYRVSIAHSSNKVNLYLDKSGTGDNFSQARVIRTYANSVMPGGRQVQPTDIDFRDYEAVRRYYGLE